MFVQGIRPLSNTNSYNYSKPAFGSATSELGKTLEKGADEFKKVAQKAADELTDAERDALKQIGFDEEPGPDLSNIDLFGTLL